MQLNDPTPRPDPMDSNLEKARRLGETWAGHSATLVEMECLMIFRAHLISRQAWHSWFEQDSDDRVSIGEYWHFAVIDPRGCNLRGRVKLNPNSMRAIVFWKAVGATHEEWSNAAFVKEFTESAAAFFRGVLPWHYRSAE